MAMHQSSPLTAHLAEEFTQLDNCCSDSTFILCDIMVGPILCDCCMQLRPSKPCTIIIASPKGQLLTFGNFFYNSKSMFKDIVIASLPLPR